jgi:hypothetical protein
MRNYGHVEKRRRRRRTFNKQRKKTLAGEREGDYEYLTIIS